jgi:photosystem II stability/assembly factor-like uncharacterized protein
MRSKNYLKILLLISSGIIILNSCNNSSSSEKKINTKSSKGYPSEWMYSQRAYPNNYINKKAIVKALKQTKITLSKKSKTVIGVWKSRGPYNVGGRIADVAISPNNDSILYVGAASGGIFKSIDKGQSWTPIFDNSGSISIGNIEIAPSNSQRIYVGTGEANAGSDSGAFFGDGMYRSDDAGNTWNHIGLNNTQHIGRIVVDPTNQDRVFVAATGTLYGKNQERGVYRTTNGGLNWDRVLFVSDSTAVIDVAINTNNPNILFAATWERINSPSGRKYGGSTSGVYRSVDGGDSWIKLAGGLPISNSETGRIGLAISESDPSTVYATYTKNNQTNDFNGLYKSIDNGNTWSLISPNNFRMNGGFGWYFGNVRVHPTDPNEVFMLGQSLVKTNGIVYRKITRNLHPDSHALEYSRKNPRFILLGTDGGAYISESGGQYWRHLNNLPITQFYNIEIDNLQPNRIYGGTQDNGTIRTISGGNSQYETWNQIFPNDGFQVNVDPNNSNNVYAESQFGNLVRSSRGVYGYFEGFIGWGINGLDYRNNRHNWNTPVEISPFNTKVIFYGSQKLHKSTDNGRNFTTISGDLTRGSFGQTNYGILSGSTLTCIAPSYNNLDVIYTGSDDGKVYVTFNGGTTWQSIDEELPNRYVTQIIIDPNDDCTAYVTFSGYRSLDYTPHIYKRTSCDSEDQSWEDISANLPSIPINDVVKSISNGNLYVATDIGVWFSQNEGDSWDILGSGLPNTIVSDIKIHEPTNTLYAGTYGRSIYSFDLNQIKPNTENYSDELKQNDITFNVYPNPIIDNFTIDLNTNELSKEGKIFLTDIYGKRVSVIYDGIITRSNQNLYLNNSIKSGIYILHLQIDNQEFMKKIFVNK